MNAKEMDLLDHIRELRARLFRVVIALLVGTLLGSIVTTSVVEFLVRPVQGRVVVLSPTEGTIIYFKVALLLGFVVALPYILFQIYAFVAPGLEKHERRFLLLSIPMVMFLFISGVAFTLLILIPLSIPVLRGILGGVVETAYSLEAYLSFVTTLTLWMGLFFQTPLVIYLLARLGFVHPRTFGRLRRFIVFAAAVVAAVITPTTDPFMMLLVTAPFVVLYEIGLLLARVAVRQRDA